MDERWVHGGPNLNSKLADMPAAWNALTERIIASAIEVHRGLGPGMPERHYEEAMEHELRLQGLRVARQVPRRVRYKGLELSECRLDLLVEELVILERKAVEHVPEVALAQLVSSLRVFELPLGLLINFHTPRGTEGVYRRINSAAARTAQTRLRGANPPSSSASSAPSAAPRSI